ncbi:MAG: hypothetical protein HZC02_04230 [Candidatus Levybacteria bacterium]|nr:hypothetical protein [Candidatus Levybacteria bacterium]
MKISIELVRSVPSGEEIELTDEQINAIRDFRASGFEVMVDGQPLEAYTSVNGAMPEAIAKFGEEMFDLVRAALTLRTITRPTTIRSIVEQSGL